MFTHKRIPAASGGAKNRAAPVSSRRTLPAHPERSPELDLQHSVCRSGGTGGLAPTEFNLLAVMMADSERFQPFAIAGATQGVL